jgi:hypothetical protein
MSETSGYGHGHMTGHRLATNKGVCRGEGTIGFGCGVRDASTGDGDGYATSTYTRIDYSRGRENVVISGYGEADSAVNTFSGSGSGCSSGYGSGIGAGYGGTPNNANDGVG